jgi:hypothetical protein
MTLKIAQDFEYVGNDYWKWGVWLDGNDDELDAVVAVEYHLHPTFPNPVREVKDRASRFRLDTRGWGVFQLRARVLLTDSSVVQLTHMLELAYPEEVDHTSNQIAPGGAANPEDADDELDLVTRPGQRRSIYLSAGSADSALASELRNSLVDQGVEVRSDDDLESGMPWEVEIERAIARADAVVALTSDIPSNWRDREVDAAAKQGVKVIPVVIGEDAVVPKSLDSLAQIRLHSGESTAKAVDSIIRALDA